MGDKIGFFVVVFTFGSSWLRYDASPGSSAFDSFTNLQPGLETTQLLVAKIIAGYLIDCSNKATEQHEKNLWSPFSNTDPSN
jgi:hypothetical protein